MLISVVRVSICCHKPATRTMKNSSILEPRMETNLTRSSSGIGRIVRFFEHAALKGEQAEVRIEVQIRANPGVELAEASATGSGRQLRAFGR